jgi:hypothetical protein
MGRRTNFAQKELLGLGRLEQTGSEHFQGHESTQEPVFGLENSTHPTLAELFENPILSQQEALGSPGQKLLGLEARQDSFAHQCAGNDPAPLFLG